MKKTISTHNGSQANREHNIRNPRATDKQEHIDKSLKSKNEILHDEKPREAYKRIFGKALDEYNAKQERADRKIKSYYNHVEKDVKRNTVYEMIVQIGNRENTGIDAPIERECLLEFYNSWEERNPNLECIGAYLHADENEGTLHMHIDYVPVAHGYTRGLKVQNGLVKAFGEQGFFKQGKETAQIQWEARENSILKQIALEHGIEVAEPTKEKRQHLDTQAYKLKAELESTKKELEKKTKEFNKIMKHVELAKDGSVLMPGVTSAKETQNQNQALKVKVVELETKVQSLENQLENVNAENEKQQRKVLDRNSIERKSIDALSKQALLSRYSENNAALKELLKPFENHINATQEYGEALLFHKKGYVEQSDLENRLKSDLKELSTRELTLVSEIKELEPILDKLQRNDSELSELNKDDLGLNIKKRFDSSKRRKELLSANAEFQNIIKKYMSYDSTITSSQLSKNILDKKTELQSNITTQKSKNDELEKTIDSKNNHLKNYRTLKCSSKVLEDKTKDMIQRIDDEYVPPKEHEHELASFQTKGISFDNIQTVLSHFPNLVDENKKKANFEPDSISKKRNRSKTKKNIQELER